MTAFLRAMLSAACAAALALTPVHAASPRPASSLTVETDPADARVFVDGRYVGQTPRLVSGLSPGPHRVRLEKSGYLENARVVEVREQQSTRLHVRLTTHGGGASSAGQVVSGGSGGGGIATNKWLWIGAGGAAAGAAAFLLKGTANLEPSLGAVTVEPASGLQGATNMTFSLPGARDPENDPLTYAWQFGDGGTGSGATVTHQYATAGTFTATVSVSDAKHTVSATGTARIISLSGTWRGNNAVYTVTITHAGSLLSVVWDDVTNGLSRRWSGPGTVSSPRNMTATLNPVMNAGGTLTLTATLDAGGNILSGNVTGFTVPFTLDVRR